MIAGVDARVIFTTAYQRYAARAFELNAADYLVKPIARRWRRRSRGAGGRSYLVARSLSKLERRLDPARFTRIHRSAIVNRARIREIVPEGSSRHTVVLADGTRLVLSRGRANHLRNWRL